MADGQKVTRLGKGSPTLTFGYGATYYLNAGDASSGTVPTSNGSNGYYFGPNVAVITANGSNVLQGPFVDFSAGSNVIFAVTSNTLNIASTGGGGGGTIITANGSNGLASVVNLVAGSGIALGVSGQDITVTNTGSGGGGGGSGALVWLQTQTASSSAQLDFTGFVSSTYTNYEFQIVDLQGATNGANLLMRMGTGAGPTYETGANYGSSTTEGRAGGVGAGGAEGGATSIGLTRNGIDSSSTLRVNGRITLYDPSGAHIKSINGIMTYFMTTGGSFRIHLMAGGDYDLTTAVTAIRFFMSTGDIAQGTIRLYGIRNS